MSKMTVVTIVSNQGRGYRQEGLPPLRGRQPSLLLGLRAFSDQACRLTADAVWLALLAAGSWGIVETPNS